MIKKRLYQSLLSFLISLL